MGKEQLMQNRLGVLSLLYSAVKGIFSFRGMIPFTLILLVITSLGAVIQSIDEKNPMPFLKSVGGKILNFEQRLVINAKQIEEAKGIAVKGDGFVSKINFTWELLKNIGNIIFGLWVMYFIFYLFYKIIGIINNDPHAILSNVLITVIIILFIEILANFIIIEEENKIDQPLANKFLPFQGIYATAKAFPYFFMPVYNVAETISEKELLNISQEVGNVSIY